MLPLFNVEAADALEFKHIPLSNGVFLVGASGDIVDGDSDRLLGAMFSVPKEATATVLVLNSPGGSPIAAERLAILIHQFKFTVLVGSAGVCASACFLLFAASTSKFYMDGSRIGVHGASVNEQETSTALSVTTLMARDAAAYGVPASIIEKMVTTEASEIAWLSEDELDAMGAHRLVLPQTPPPSVPSAAPYDSPFTPANKPSQPMMNAPSATSHAPPIAAKVNPLTKIPPDASSPSYQQGRNDRMNWEQWFASLLGDMRLGAEYWTGERSKRQPGNCVGTPQFASGCRLARERLARPDTLRKTDAQYWWGWNSL